MIGFYLFNGDEDGFAQDPHTKMMDLPVFQSTDNVSKNPPVKVDLETEVHKPFLLNEVRHVKLYIYTASHREHHCMININ